MPMISERAREELLLQTTDVLPFKACNRFLLMWSLRHKENDVLDDSDDVSDVSILFLNMYRCPAKNGTWSYLKNCLSYSFRLRPLTNSFFFCKTIITWCFVYTLVYCSQI